MKRIHEILLLVAASLPATAQTAAVHESFGGAVNNASIDGYGDSSHSSGLDGTWSLSGNPDEDLKSRATTAANAWSGTPIPGGGHGIDSVGGEHHFWQKNNAWGVSTAGVGLANAVDLSSDGTFYMSFFAEGANDNLLAQLGLADSLGGTELMWGNAYGDNQPGQGLTAYFGPAGSAPTTNSNGTHVPWGNYQTMFLVAELTKSDSGNTNALTVRIKVYNLETLLEFGDLDTVTWDRTVGLTGVTGSFDTLQARIAGGGGNFPAIDELRLGDSWLDVTGSSGGIADPGQPNILWLVAEDMSPTIGPYGDRYAITPNLDAFSATALRYERAWSNGAVCSAARSTLITGMFGNTTGVNFHRSLTKASPPSFLKFYPQLMQEAGYYTSNNAKTDYNMSAPGGNAGWNANGGSAHWRNRPAGKPFLAVFNYGQTHEGQVDGGGTGPHDPAGVPLPECHPDIPSARQQWANHYNDITSMDAAIQTRLDQLAADGLADDTIVFFYSDHGSGMPGYKRYVGNRGQQVALLVRFPEKYAHLAPPGYTEGGSTDELVSFVDFPPTLLSLAGVEPPSWHHGRAFAGQHRDDPPDYLHGYADRFDERTWLTRSVHDGRYVYIRNYRPDLPHGLHNEYAFSQTFIGEWQSMFHHGGLTPEQAHHWMPQGPEELYDLQTDPDEVRNLAGDPGHQAKLAELRDAHRAFRDQYPDAGFLTEGILFDRAEDSGLTQYDLLRDPTHYPPELVDTMDRASIGDGSDVPTLVSRLTHIHPSVRHWALIGLMLQGRETVRANEPAISARMSDRDFWVRATAAQVLGTHGSAGAQATALGYLFAEGAGPTGTGQNHRRTLFALRSLDELPLIPESYRFDINTLQNNTFETQSFRRHMWYGYYEQYSNPLLEFRHLHGLDRFGADDLGNPSGDGISNLMKFACNLAPEEGDLLVPASPRSLPPGGSAGLPVLFHDEADGRRMFQYLRRIPAPDSSDTDVRPTPNISYFLERSPGLSGWTDDDAPEEVAPIDSEWERVSLPVPGLGTGFRRLRVGP